MARIQSAVKNIRKNRRRNEINRSRRTRLRNQLKKMRSLIDSRDAAAAKNALPSTMSLIDRSLKNGIIRQNTAARYKSRLSRHVTALGRSR